MKINFTKEEYRLLVEMLYLAEWMMNAHDVESNYKEHVNLKEKIFSHYKEMEAEDIIEYSKELDGYYELANFDEEMQGNFIEPYDDNVFWGELLERLSVRDVINKIGSEKYDSMNGIEKGMAVDEVKERYAKEFAKNGLANLKLINTN